MQQRKKKRKKPSSSTLSYPAPPQQNHLPSCVKQSTPDIRFSDLISYQISSSQPLIYWIPFPSKNKFGQNRSVKIRFRQKLNQSRPDSWRTTMNPHHKWISHPISAINKPISTKLEEVNRESATPEYGPEERETERQSRSEKSCHLKGSHNFPEELVQAMNFAIGYHRRGKMTHRSLGVSSSILKHKWDSGHPSGTTLSSQVAEDSLAYSSGLRSQDVIVQCDGESVRSILEFVENIWDKAGGTVEFSILRLSSGERLKLTTTIDETTPDKFYRWPIPVWSSRPGKRPRRVSDSESSDAVLDCLEFPCLGVKSYTHSHSK